MAFHPQTNALYIPIELTCERATFNVRAEFSNIFNRTLMTVSGSTAPTGGYVQPSTTIGATPATDAFGRYTNGFGTINTTGTVNGERQGTIVARFTF